MTIFDQKIEMENFCNRCKSLGLAVTVQRRAVYQILLDSLEHPSADKIYEELITQYPNISRTSVYRILDTFARYGIIRKVDHPGAATRYDAYVFPHHHAVCVSCGEIIDVPFSSGDDEALRRVQRQMNDFIIRDYMVTFQGICHVCKNKEEDYHFRT